MPFPNIWGSSLPSNFNLNQISSTISLPQKLSWMYETQTYICHWWKLIWNTSVISEIATVKYLGTLLQNNLVWQNHSHQLKIKLSPIMGVMFKLKDELNKTARLLIFGSLIQSRIHYLLYIVYAYKGNSDLKSL